jgi:DNA-binding MarR family transcriptional regulator
MLQAPHPRSRGATSAHAGDGPAVAPTRGAIDRVLAVLEQRGLSPTEVRVLLHLLEREASLVEVANSLDHPPSVITRAAGGLDSRGLVRWFHAAHTKQTRLAITADGLATMRALLDPADRATGEAPSRESHEPMTAPDLVLVTGGSTS